MLGVAEHCREVSALQSCPRLRSCSQSRGGTRDLEGRRTTGGHEGPSRGACESWGQKGPVSTAGVWGAGV